MGELEISEKKIEDIHKNLKVIANEEKMIENDINSSRISYENAKSNFARRSETYKEHIRAMYKRQKISPVGMLFTAGSISSMMRGFRMFKSVALADASIMEQMDEQVKSIQTALDKLELALNSKIELEKTKKNEQLSLASLKEKKKKILDEIVQDEKLHELRIKKFRNELSQSQAQLDKFLKERKKSGISIPSSLKGYDFSARRGKLPWPVRGRVVSNFGSVIDPVTKTETNNRGIEIETRQGESVMAVANGQVVMTRYFRGYGNFVVVFHPPDYYSIYGHLNDWLVNEGDIISEGSVVGLAGSTGAIDNGAPRLSLEILKGEIPQNPILWLKSDRSRAGN